MHSLGWDTAAGATARSGPQNGKQNGNGNGNGKRNGNGNGKGNGKRNGNGRSHALWFEIPDFAWPRPSVRPATMSERLVRGLNVVVALLGILVSAPLMLVIAVLVKFSSPGPVLFIQKRVGQDRRARPGNGAHWRRRADYGGRLFAMYKFRTMRSDEAPGAQSWATQDDPRITPFGRFLRRTRLDELPQLFNVLNGDMNVVGPRPEQPEIFAGLREQIEFYPHRQRVRPGITGWAQINWHYDRSVEDVRRKLSYDLEYIQRQSVVQDLQIMVRTLPVMLLRKGAL